jgi:hypothetical protein
MGMIIDFSHQTTEKRWSSKGKRYFKRFKCGFCGKTYGKNKSYSIVDGLKSCEVCDDIELKAGEKKGENLES